jgi:hypothetical protein
VDKLLSYGIIGAGVAFAILFVQLARARALDRLTTGAFFSLAVLVIVVGAYLQFDKQHIEAAQLDCVNDQYIGTGTHPFSIRDETTHSKRISGDYRLVAFSCRGTGADPILADITDRLCEFKSSPGTTGTLTLTYCKVKRP